VQSTSADTVTTTTGLRFIEERVGTGHAVQSCREATVRYTGFVFEGDQFDHRTITAVPGTGQLIPGFEQGMVGISTGGLRRVIIPPHLGYGGIARLNTAGDTIIPANATLIFDLEVLAASN
jgi:FKBP-type peptidyl-prolyl cis-trans isomerase